MHSIYSTNIEGPLLGHPLKAEKLDIVKHKEEEEL